MDELDRLGWAAGISFKSYGVRLGIRVNDASVLDRLVDLLPHGSEPISSPVVDGLYSVILTPQRSNARVRHFHFLYENSDRLERTLQVDAIFRTLESSMKMIVALWAHRRIFIHAGVVGWRGRAILVPGRGFSGKTTLVTELVKAGATYYSDEFAVLDARGRVHPYSTPLSVRSGDDLVQESVEVEELGGKVGRKPLPVGLVIATSYKPEGMWRPRRLSPGEGMLELLSHTVAARTQPELAMTALKQTVADARVMKGNRGQASSTAKSILDSSYNWW
jgi:hypothetical protein